MRHIITTAYLVTFQKSSPRIPSNDSAICEDIPEDRETNPNHNSEQKLTRSDKRTGSAGFGKQSHESPPIKEHFVNRSEQKQGEHIKRSDSEPIQSRRKDSGVSSSDEDKIIFVRRARRRKSVLK